MFINNKVLTVNLRSLFYNGNKKVESVLVRYNIRAARSLCRSDKCMALCNKSAVWTSIGWKNAGIYKKKYCIISVYFFELSGGSD